MTTQLATLLGVIGGNSLNVGDQTDSSVEASAPVGKFMGVPIYVSEYAEQEKFFEDSTTIETVDGNPNFQYMILEVGTVCQVLKPGVDPISPDLPGSPDKLVGVHYINRFDIKMPNHIMINDLKPLVDEAPTPPTTPTGLVSPIASGTVKVAKTAL